MYLIRSTFLFYPFSGGRHVIDRSDDIHSRVLTLDTHADIPANFATPEIDPGQWGTQQVDLPKMRKGGLDATFLVVYVSQEERTPENYRTAMNDALVKFDAIHRMAEVMYPEQIEIAVSPADVRRIRASGKLVAAIGIENGFSIGKDLSLLSTYYELGGRYLTLAHIGHNDICDSSLPRDRLGDPDEEHGGLSEFGRDVVREMNRIGMMVDVSHISRKAMLDAARASRVPVVASHSGVCGINPHPRNLDDEQLDVLRDQGGVIQIVAYVGYVKSDPVEKTIALEQLRKKYNLASVYSALDLPKDEKALFSTDWDVIQERYPRANVQDFVDHIDYAVNRIGIRHVGISSDFDGGGGIEGWDNTSESMNVTSELVARGYSEGDIQALWGDNFLRVWQEAEDYSRSC